MGPSERSETCWGALGKVRDGSGISQLGPTRVGEPLGEVWDGLRDRREGQVWVRGNSGKFGTGRGTHAKVWDRSRDLPEGTGRVGGPSRRSSTGLETLGEVRDGSGNPRVGPGRVGGQ